MAETLWQYLKENAKFLSPPTAGQGVSTTSVNVIEVDALAEDWKPKEARRDDRMVDSLLETLRDWLNDRTLPGQQLETRFQPVVDDHGTHFEWRQINDNENAASRMVSAGALSALDKIMGLLGCPITAQRECRASGFSSHPDFVLSTSANDSGKVLVEIKAPSVLQHAINGMATGSFPLRLNSRAPTDEKVINKLCLYMAAHKARWAAVTSHDKWVFVRLHPASDLGFIHPCPYVSFSTVEKQTDNTRPFRALLAMMVATAFSLTVQSHADNAELSTIIEDDHDDEDDTPQNDPGEDKSRSFRGSGKGGRGDRRITREEAKRIAELGAQKSESTGLVLRWSTAVVRRPFSFAFTEIGTTAQRLSLGAGTVRLALQRVIGTGLTGTVYEASRISNKPNPQLYAVKVIVKGSPHRMDKASCLNQVFHEFDVYCKIECAKLNGEIPACVTPRCYGLYESETMLALLMDYEGTALLNEDWDALQHPEKEQIFMLAAALHKIGIIHCDLEPRNVLRTSTSYKIIDFGLASSHRCPGIKEVPWTKSASRRECTELKSLWNQLGLEPKGIARLGQGTSKDNHE